MNTAVMSTDGKYRYRLERQWGPSDVKLTFIMLNPSTADADNDDPTIRRCISFAKRDGFNGIRVLNLYALRATNPKDLWLSDDPVGPENDNHLHQAGNYLVAAWGANAKPDRVAEVADILGAHATTYCLGVTKGGAPRHPLYIKGDARFVEWVAA